MLLYFCTFKIHTSLEVKYEIYSCALEPRSTDSLGHQHRAKKLSPKIELHVNKVLCESKATLPYILLLYIVERIILAGDFKIQMQIPSTIVQHEFLWRNVYCFYLQIESETMFE